MILSKCTVCDGKKLTIIKFQEVTGLLRSNSPLPQKFVLIASLKNPSKTDKKIFYFILKALFVLKIFKFLSWLFGHLGIATWLER